MMFRLFHLAKTTPDRIISFMSACDGPLAIAEIMSRPVRSQLGFENTPKLSNRTTHPQKEIMKFRWGDNLDRLQHWAHDAVSTP